MPPWWSAPCRTSDEGPKADGEAMEGKMIDPSDGEAMKRE